MTATINPPEPLVTAPLAATQLGVHRNTILNMAKDGRITPAGRLPGPRGAWLFTPSELDRVQRLLESHAA